MLLFTKFKKLFIKSLFLIRDIFHIKKENNFWRSLKANEDENTIYNNSIFAWDISQTSFKIRIGFIIFCFTICFLIISYKLILISSNNFTKKNNYNNNINHFRKEIIDRNGSLLAVNLPSSSLYANPQKVINIEDSIDRLGKIINIDQKKLIKELSTNKTFVWIKRDLTPIDQQNIIKLGLPGFNFEKEQKRVYTYENLFSHVIGYVGRDFTGLSGLEKSFDNFLTNSDINLKKEEYNRPLQLSIDVRLQNILNEEIEKVITQFKAIGAIGMIADPNNGEILAMVSKPDFNPHNPQNATEEQLFNSGSMGVRELGSAFKCLTLAIGLDTEIITLNDAYDLSYMRVGKFQVKDYHPMKGWHSVPEIFLHSSNIGVGQIMLEIGKTNLKRYLKALGLLDQLKLELPERGTPLFPRDSKWTDLSLVTMSYGYALSISAAHFIQAMIPVVNGGNLYPLTLIKRDGEIPQPTRIFKESTSKEMRKLLRLVVQEGTGRKAEVKGYLVGGKTGTAHKAVGGKYAKNTRISSFFATLPVSDPKYIIYIMFDEPKGTKETFGFATAGWTAAPAVKKVIERMISLYGIKPLNLDDENIQEILNLQFKINDEV